MHDGMPYGRIQGQGQGHSREVDRQSPTGLIFFVCLSRSESGALFVRGWHTLKKYCVVVYRSILMQFISFFRKGLPFQMS